ncbi:MAG: enoyl-CoA hydratase/isomerase family protein [Alphaproteobacteria bacterium]|nr:enoyl-CoA hydratase/isomerase family protein [Alphaproteobacteria bacterium]MDE2341225.1 enoyl-CoA hydratase/isomerase family protein [Alphaproteobacteria bacterium]
MDALPHFETLLLTRQGRLLTLTLNRPDALNAFNLQMHDELPEALIFARSDAGSDVLLLTGAGRAFSAGGDLDHIARNAANPELFDHEVDQARRIITTLMDIDKPVICRMNGHAVGLGATIALFCDIIFAQSQAKIGDPHVALGLVAGDGGAIIWPALIGAARAKEYLLTGELLSAERAAAIGLINHALSTDALDEAVIASVARLLAGAQFAIRATKRLANAELKRLVAAQLDAGLELERQSVRTADHREGVAALKEKRTPKFGKGSEHN